MFSLYSNGSFLNFFIWNIKTSNIFFKISGLTRVIPCNPGPGSLAGSSGSGMITILEAIATVTYCPYVLLASIANINWDRDQLNSNAFQKRGKQWDRECEAIDSDIDSSYINANKEANCGCNLENIWLDTTVSLL
jgi:hypothetical protein